MNRKKLAEFLRYHSSQSGDELTGLKVRVRASGCRSQNAQRGAVSCKGPVCSEGGERQMVVDGADREADYDDVNQGFTHANRLRDNVTPRYIVTGRDQQAWQTRS